MPIGTTPFLDADEE